MKALVTGSSGHLGEAMVRTLRAQETEVVGVDLLESPHTSVLGSIVDRRLVGECLQGVDVVYHTATLHKPHVGTHSKKEFVNTNITGTLNLLEGALENGVKSFIFTSTTSVFGDAMKPKDGEPAVWVTEDVEPLPKNIYGVTKTAAEDLCHLFHRRHGLPVVVLRTSRFFPEEDDDPNQRSEFSGDNLKVNEFLFRRVEIADVVSAHLAAEQRAAEIGFGRYIVSATTPFSQADLDELRNDAPAVVRRLIPEYETVFAAHKWRMFDHVGRVYVNAAARRDLGWQPIHDFRSIINRLKKGGDFRSQLAIDVGAKGYHSETFEHGPYPVE
ncbi:MAG: NAD-dependent epimerase/dehydratase family protein [Limisphaerales bacterium]